VAFNLNAWVKPNTGSTQAFFLFELKGRSSKMFIVLVFLLQVADEPILSPRTVAIVTAATGLVFAALALWQLNIHRARGVIGALASAYGLIVPYISTFPRTYGVVLAIIGLVLTLTAERIQGGASSEEVRQAAAESDFRKRNEL
jgi:hypothetical protein